MAWPPPRVKAKHRSPGHHALCWGHAERLVHKLDALTDKHRAARMWVRGLRRNFHASLKFYRLKPSPRRAVALSKRFERIYCRRHPCFVTLDRPEIPLQTNSSENDIRYYVTRRKAGAGPSFAYSVASGDAGRDCCDAFHGLAKTRNKLCIADQDYLGVRLKMAGRVVVQPLHRYVRARFRPA